MAFCSALARDRVSILEPGVVAAGLGIRGVGLLALVATVGPVVLLGFEVAGFGLGLGLEAAGLDAAGLEAAGLVEGAAGSTVSFRTFALAVAFALRVARLCARFNPAKRLSSCKGQRFRRGL